MNSPLTVVLRHKQQFRLGSSNAIKFWRLIGGFGGGGGGNEVQPMVMMIPKKLSRVYSNCTSSGGGGSQLINCFEKSVIKIGGGGGYQWNRGMVGCACGEMITRGFKTSAYQYAQTDDEALAKGDKVLKVKLKATRLDAVLKAGLSLSRNKIEKAFYDDRVRVNGKRPSKKSQVVYEGDEIDIVRGYNKLNPDQFIDVSRVEIEELKDPKEAEGSDADSDSDDDDGTTVPAKLRRSKLLTIKNYKMPWKGNSSD